MPMLLRASYAACYSCRMPILTLPLFIHSCSVPFLPHATLAACHSSRMPFLPYVILAACHCQGHLPPQHRLRQDRRPFISGAGSFSKKGFISSSVLGSLKKNDVVKYKQLCSNNCFKQKWSSTTTCKSRQCEFFQYEHLTRTCKLYDASAASEFTLVKNPRRTSFSRPNQCPVHCVVPAS